MSAKVNSWKNETQKQWNTTPCGTVPSKEENLEYFLAVEHRRYEDRAPWLKPLIRFDNYKEKKVLEVGFGQGTDLCQFALGGADCYGVDLTQRHYELAKKNFALRGLKAELHWTDASKLPFPDESFDLVYSFGVLHHTPDTNRCIGEIFRVLKPGGEFILGVYHHWSIRYWFSTLLQQGLLKGDLKKLGYQGLLSTIERGADGINIKPLVKLYTSKQLRIMLSDFQKVSFQVRQLRRSDFGPLKKMIPNFVFPHLETKMGFFLFAKATK